MTARLFVNPRMLAILATGALMLQACSGDRDEAGGEAKVSNQTLASVVAGTDGLSTVSDALGETGLAQVFDGAAAYTLFAPQDAAFEALGQAGEDLRSAEQRPAMVAILRDHIVPGYLTHADIGNAISLADDGSVEMRTMGDRRLTFTEAGDRIVVTAEDGASARFVGEPLRTNNGVAIPLDGLLRNIGEAPVEG